MFEEGPVVTLTPGAQQSLEASRRWIRLVAVALLAVATILALFGMLGLVITVALGPRGGTTSPATLGVVFSLFYLGMATLYLLPGLYLSRYASALARLQQGGEEALEEAFKQHRLFWRFAGILTLVSLGLGILGTLAAIIVPALAMAFRR